MALHRWQVALVAVVAVASSWPLVDAREVAWDDNGYLAMCPCSGRFGNQVELFLHALMFASQTERSPILPHFVLHNFNRDTEFERFEDIFDADAMRAQFPNAVTWPVSPRPHHSVTARRPGSLSGAMMHEPPRCRSRASSIGHGHGRGGREARAGAAMPSRPIAGRQPPIARRDLPPSLMTRMQDGVSEAAWRA